MNVDELKQGLATMAAEVEDRGNHERLAGVDHKVAVQRRTRVLGTGLVAAVAVAAVALAPSLVDRTDAPTQPAGRTDGLPTVTERGTAFYTHPAGSTLIGHAVSAPGAVRISFTFTPSTLDLGWDDECSDPGVTGPDKGAWYSTSVNGHPLGGSTCEGKPDRGPLTAAGSFGASPLANKKGWSDLGVKVGEPSTFTVRISRHADLGIAPRLVAGVWERGGHLETDGVWYDRQVVYKGHTYEAVAAKVAQLDGQKMVRAQVSLPHSEHDLYVAQGAANVSRGLRLFPDSVGIDAMSRGVTGTGAGALVSSDRRIALVRAHPMNPDATGKIYVLVYERID